MNALVKSLEYLPKWIGEKSSWLSSILVGLIVFDVISRYIFSNTKTWIIELEWHLFALIFLFGAAHAYQKDQHVRVDVFYAKFSDRKKAFINITGILFFLIPWCGVVIYTAINYAVNSFSFLEGSPNPGGLPARYVIKFCIALGFFLLLLQAIAELLKNISKFKTN